MPQKTSLENKGNAMKTFLIILVLILSNLGTFAAGYYSANQGYRVVNSSGNSVVKSNAAQIVKDENARLGREVIGKTEDEAEQLLQKENRTMFVGIRDGEVKEYKGQKTFTNLTLEVKNGKVVKVLGWY
jgi:hypothetical protein